MNAPESIVEDAVYYSEHNGRFWSVLRRLREYTRDQGPIPLPDGRMCGQFADGYSWDSDVVAEVMPQLLTEAAVTYNGPLEQVERVMSLVAEELPDLPFEVKRGVNVSAANGVIRAGGAAAEKLRPARVEKAKLGVR